MVETSKSYDGAPVGAVFEATQKALQAMGFHIGRTDAATFAIVAHPGASPWYASRQIDVAMREIGLSTQVTLGGSLLDAAGTEEASALVGNLFDAIDVEIRKIRDAGRILPVDGPKYGFGQAAAPPVPPPIASAPVPPAPPVLPAQPVPEAARATPAAAAKSGSGGWFWKAAVIGGIVLLLNTKTGQDLLDEVMRSVSLETDIARYDCAKVADLVKGTKVQNLFGAQFEVLDIRNVTPATKTDDKIACTADLDLSNATTQRMTIMVRRGSSPSEIVYGVEPL